MSINALRALIPPTSIKPIDASPKSLSLKRTVGFMKASKELARHQELLQNSPPEMDDQSGGENELEDEQVIICVLSNFSSKFL